MTRFSQPGRVKVTLRCRPPFEDELEEDGTFQPVVGVTSVGRVNKITLTGDATVRPRCWQELAPGGRGHSDPHGPGRAGQGA